MLTTCFGVDGVQLYITYIFGEISANPRRQQLWCAVIGGSGEHFLNIEIVTYINKVRSLQTKNNLSKMKIHNDPANRDPGAHLRPKSWGR